MVGFSFCKKDFEGIMPSITLEFSWGDLFEGQLFWGENGIYILAIPVRVSD